MTSTPTPAFGTLLRRYRRVAGLTQEGLAERAGLSAHTVSDLECGVKLTPRRDTLALLLDALGLSAEERRRVEAAARRLKGAVRAGAALTPPSAPPLVGRAREVAALERHLAGEGPPVLLLAGEPGIGKSRLVQEAGARAAQAGWTVLAGGCHRRGGQDPYAPLLEALARYIRLQTPAQLRTDLRGCAWLVRLLPELAAGPIEPLPDWTLSPEQDRRLMVAAVGRFLTNVAGPPGTLLLLDDLHWAGPDALDVLMALARSTPEAPLRIVGAYRETEVSPQHPLAVLLADLADAGLAAQRRLGRLSPEEAGQLLATLLPDGVEGATMLRERVVQRTGGVPFYLVSCAQALRLGELAGSPTAVPWDVAQSIRQRVATLPPAAQEVLDAAAVAVAVADEWSPPAALLSAVVDYPERAVLAALEAAWRARLLDETAGGHRFAHDLVREVVEADLSAARRRVLHRRIATALEQQPGEPPVQALAYHWAQSGDREKAVPYLEQAGDRARVQGAHVAAEGYYREVVEALDGLGRVQEAARAREKLGAALSTLARYAEALAVLDRAAERYRADSDLESEGRVTAQIGRLHVERGTPEQGLQRVQPLVARLAARGPSAALGALHMALTDIYFFAARYSEDEAAAAAVAQALGDDRLLSAAQGARGSALETMGRIAEGLQALQEALQLAESSGELGSPSDIDMLIHAAQAMSYSGQVTGSLRYSERAVSAAERLGDPRYMAWTLGFRGENRVIVGDWEGARPDLERAVALHRQLGVSPKSAWALTFLGRLHGWEGAWEEATSELVEALAIAEHGGDRLILLMCQGELAEIEIRQGQPAAACRRLFPLLEHRDLRRQHLHFVIPRLAWAHLALGETGAAQEWVRQVVDFAREAGGPDLLAQVLWLHALVATQQEHWEEAERALEEGLSLTRSLPYPYLEARTLWVYGAMHRRKGAPEPARAKLEAALALFRRLGARKDSAQVEQDLATLG